MMWASASWPILICPSLLKQRIGNLKAGMSTGRRAYDLLRGYVNNEFERLQRMDDASAEQELNESLEMPTPTGRTNPNSEVITLTQEEKARQVLGVSTSATFEEIKKAFDKLCERSDPAKFPSGSAEADQATEIRSRIYRAYRILSDKFDPTETRFKSLEIE
ncbi:hypothetical protein BH11ARM1_BH11ARM1_15040 [soil metagenome]